MTRYTVTGAVIMILIGTGLLIFGASSAEGIVYKTAREIRAESDATRSYRLTGHAKRGSIEKIPAERRVNFVVIDHDSAEMRATYAGIVPDTFKDRAEVVLTGHYDPKRDLFVGSELLAKCPSKYQGQYDSTAAGFNQPAGAMPR
ncbi:MAG: cytochrome c maturation protein CcmE [Candidatus Hydrogenedentota bacterium]